ncbi:MAG TPA: hypothetical protein VHW09_14555 [Bryobacteraceae bacterium]|jgi:uncharacterized protein (TIGR03437 family)|nr:hypothetical protein [Bryobacteraceae bacterium]
MRGMRWRLLIPFLLSANLLPAQTAPTIAPLPANTYAAGIRIDSAGNLILAGYYFANPSDEYAPAHAFAAKMSPDASRTLWWTTLAGSGDDRALGLALGADDAVYVTGQTQSTDFPVTKGAFSTSGNGFVTKLDNATGATLYATYVPAYGGQAIAVDATGDAFITGQLSSTDALPPTAGTVTDPGSPFAAVPLAGPAGYILELDPPGAKALLTIVGFGGSQIALDPQGNIYAVGALTNLVDPVTAGAFQRAPADGPAPTVCASFPLGFFGILCTFQHVAKIDPTGTKLIYATYLNGRWGASPAGILVESDGSVILAGTTQSPDYPTTPDAYQPQYPANPLYQDAPVGPDSSAPDPVVYVTRLSADGTSLVWSTFFGGSAGSSIGGVAMDAGGNILIEGSSSAPADLPARWDTGIPTRQSASWFVARLSPDAADLSSVQLLNGPSPRGGGIAVAADGTVAIAGPATVGVTSAAPGRIKMICDSADEAKLAAVAPGQLLTLYGSNLATEGLAPSANGFPVSFNGVTVTFNGIPAPILYTAGGQINLQVPYEIAGQTEVTMLVSNPTVTPPLSESYVLVVAPRLPSVDVSAAGFSAPLYDLATCNGQNVVGIQPLAFNADGSLNTCANPAAAASPVTIIVNGLGPTSPSASTGAISPASTPLTPFAISEPYFGYTGAPAIYATESLGASTSALAQVQIPAPATSSAVMVQVADTSGAVFPVRGPGVVIWVAPPK